MKGIYIYLPENGKEYSNGARAELSDTPDGNVYAFVSSPLVDVVWDGFRQRTRRHGSRCNAATILISDLVLALFDNEQVPFRCLHKLNDTEWSYTERSVVSEETARSFMR